MAVLTGPLASTTLLLCVVLVLTLVAAPAHAWMNETRTIRRCNVSLSTVYTPVVAIPLAPLELDNATTTALFQAHVRQWWADRIASSTPAYPPGFMAVSFDEFVNTLRGRLDPVIEAVDNGTTSRRLSRAVVYVEGSFEVEEYDCRYAAGTMDMEMGVLGWSVSWSVEQTLFGQLTNVSARLQPYNFGIVTLDERTYDVLVPTEEDLCRIRFEGSYQLGFPLDRYVDRPDATVVFTEEVAALVRLTVFGWWNFHFQVSQMVPNDPLQFIADLIVLKNESVGLTSLLAPAVMRTLERITDAPYDSSELRIKPSRACYVPPPVWVQRCVQVSAKLESGAPFGLNSSSANSSSIFNAFSAALGRALVDQQVLNRVWDVQVQSVAAVPLEQADTLQVAVRVDYEVDQKDETKGVSMIGRQVTSALETTAVEVAPSSLYEVAYTITPCHTPSAFSS